MAEGNSNSLHQGRLRALMLLGSPNPDAFFDHHIPMMNSTRGSSRVGGCSLARAMDMRRALPPLLLGRLPQRVISRLPPIKAAAHTNGASRSGSRPPTGEVDRQTWLRHLRAIIVADYAVGYLLATMLYKGSTALVVLLEVLSHIQASADQGASMNHASHHIGDQAITTADDLSRGQGFHQKRHSKEAGLLQPGREKTQSHGPGIRARGDQNEQSNTEVQGVFPRPRPLQPSLPLEGSSSAERAAVPDTGGAGGGDDHGGSGQGGGSGGSGGEGGADGHLPEKPKSVWLAIALSLALVLPPNGLVELVLHLSRWVSQRPNQHTQPQQRRPSLARRTLPRQRRLVLLQHAACEARDGQGLVLISPSSAAASLLFPNKAAQLDRKVRQAAAVASLSLDGLPVEAQIAGLATAVVAMHEREARIAARLITRRIFDSLHRQEKVSELASALEASRRSLTATQARLKEVSRSLEDMQGALAVGLAQLTDQMHSILRERETLQVQLAALRHRATTASEQASQLQFQLDAAEEDARRAVQERDQERDKNALLAADLQHAAELASAVKAAVTSLLPVPDSMPASSAVALTAVESKGAFASVQQLVSAVSQLQQEKESLQTQLRSQQEAHAAGAEALDLAQQEAASRLAQAADLEVQLASAFEYRVVLEGQLSAAQNELNSVRSQLAFALQELASANSTAAAAEWKLRDAQAAAEAAEKGRQAVDQRCRDMTKQLHAIQAQREAAEAAGSSLAQRLEISDTELVRARAQLQQEQNEKAHALTERAALQQNLAEAKQQLDSARVKAADRATELEASLRSAAQDEKDQLEARIATLVAAQSEAEVQSTEALQRLRQQAAALEAVLEETQTGKLVAEQNAVGLQRAVTALEAQLALKDEQLDNRIQQAEERAAFLQAALLVAEAAVPEATAAAAREAEAAADLRTRIAVDHLCAEIASLRAQLEDAGTAQRTAAQELATLRTTLDGTRLELKQAEQDLAALRLRERALEAQVADAERLMQVEIEQREQRVEELQCWRAEAEADLADAQQERKALQKQLSSASSQAAHTATIIEDLSKKAADAEGVYSAHFVHTTVRVALAQACFLATEEELLSLKAQQIQTITSAHAGGLPLPSSMGSFGPANDAAWQISPVQRKMHKNTASCAAPSQGTPTAVARIRNSPGGTRSSDDFTCWPTMGGLAQLLHAGPHGDDASANSSTVTGQRAVHEVGIQVAYAPMVPFSTPATNYRRSGFDYDAYGQAGIDTRSRRHSRLGVDSPSQSMDDRLAGLMAKAEKNREHGHVVHQHLQASFRDRTSLREALAARALANKDSAMRTSFYSIPDTSTVRDSDQGHEGKAGLGSGMASIALDSESHHETGLQPQPSQILDGTYVASSLHDIKGMLESLLQQSRPHTPMASSADADSDVLAVPGTSGLQQVLMRVRELEEYLGYDNSSPSVEEPSAVLLEQRAGPQQPRYTDAGGNDACGGSAGSSEPPTTSGGSPVQTPSVDSRTSAPRWPESSQTLVDADATMLAVGEHDMLKATCESETVSQTSHHQRTVTIHAETDGELMLLESRRQREAPANQVKEPHEVAQEGEVHGADDDNKLQVLLDGTPVMGLELPVAQVDVADPGSPPSQQQPTGEPTLPPAKDAQGTERQSVETHGSLVSQVEASSDEGLELQGQDSLTVDSLPEPQTSLQPSPLQTPVTVRSARADSAARGAPPTRMVTTNSEASSGLGETMAQGMSYPTPSALRVAADQGEHVYDNPFYAQTPAASEAGGGSITTASRARAAPMQSGTVPHMASFDSAGGMPPIQPSESVDLTELRRRRQIDDPDTAAVANLAQDGRPSAPRPSAGQMHSLPGGLAGTPLAPPSHSDARSISESLVDMNNAESYIADPRASGGLLCLPTNRTSRTKRFSFTLSSRQGSRSGTVHPADIALPTAADEGSMGSQSGSQRASASVDMPSGSLASSSLATADGLPVKKKKKGLLQKLKRAMSIGSSKDSGGAKTALTTSAAGVSTAGLPPRA